MTTNRDASAPVGGMPRLPIVYLRGYAGPTTGIDEQVDDPFYGFNAGATHVRVDGDGDPAFYQFEGPLLRLMKDEGYQLLVHGDQQRLLTGATPATLPSDSIWVYRFYDQAATTFRPDQEKSAEGVFEHFLHPFKKQGSAPTFNIEDAARGLYDMILRIRSGTAAPKVYLVAHSMGGLVARCMIQKICHQDGRVAAKDIVASLFTYGTPHGGIVTELGFVNWSAEHLGPAGSDIFSPALMYGYLTPGATFGDRAPDGWDPRGIDADDLDADNIFCLIGTDPKDYGAVPRLAVGPKSDGLVRIDNAYVPKAHRAYVYRSHSGRYGEVNSEEGYQNLRRFLFGRWAVTIELAGLPAALPREPESPRTQRMWQADMRLAVRGLPVLLSEQQAAQWCPIQLNVELSKPQDNPDHPVPLVRTFLLDPARLAVTGGPVPHQGRARYVLTLRIQSLHQGTGGFDFTNHLEQVPDWAGSLIVDIGPEGTDPGPFFWAAWANDIPAPNDIPDPVGDGPLTFAMAADGRRQATVPLPPTATSLDIFGGGAALTVTVADRYPIS